MNRKRGASALALPALAVLIALTASVAGCAPRGGAGGGMAATAAPAPVPTPEPASDWPQYRGAARDGVALDSELSWPDAGPRILWKKELGPAYSQLAVRGDEVYTGTSDAEFDYAVRLDADSGDEVWRTKLGPVFEESFGNGPRSTPTVDGDRLYIVSGKGNVVALATEDGAELWSIDLVEEFGFDVPRFGFGGAPLVLGDKILIESGAAEDKALIAVDRETGEYAWTALQGRFSYSSPIVAEVGGVSQIVAARGKTLSGLTLDGAEVLWSHELPGGVIATPISLGDGRFFLSSNNDEGCAMVRVERAADGTYAAETLWSNREMKNPFNSTIHADGYIYGFDNATLKCLSAETGEVAWAKRGFGKGSVLLAGDDLVVLADDGRLLRVEATPEAYREKGTIEVLEGRSWTAPSMAGGRVFVRNMDQAACIDLRG